MAPRQVLTIAGSDSGAGAGLQADLKAIHAHGCYALTVVTAVTAQNTLTITRSHTLPADIVRAQIDAVFEDFDIAAVKTGMLATAAVVEAVASALIERSIPHLVVDPAMVSKSGFPLLNEPAIEALKIELIPAATVITPNLYEAEVLANMEILSEEDMKTAGRRILDLGCGAVVVKGGHLSGAGATDVLVTPDGAHEYPGNRIESAATHGVGCTFASALAAQLALGSDLPEAVRAAKDYTFGAIQNAPDLGKGPGPTDHFWKYGVRGHARINSHFRPQVRGSFDRPE